MSIEANFKECKHRRFRYLVELLTIEVELSKCVCHWSQIRRELILKVWSFKTVQVLPAASFKNDPLFLRGVIGNTSDFGSEEFRFDP